MSDVDMKKPKTEALGDKQAFVDMFPSLVEEIITDVQKSYPDYNAEAVQWLRKVLEYNCPGGKMNRGLSVIASYRHLVGDRELSLDEVRNANILGWCVEWLQAFFLVADDLMDGSITRRGQPCWYKQEGVNLIAINDSFLIESCIYKLLRKHFRSQSYYVDLLELFHETTFQTELGQLLDLNTAPEDKIDLTRFTIEKFAHVAAAMLMAGIKPENEQAYKHAQEILLEMGVFFQVQDDYLDCYGSPEVIGKIGTDIEDNKCGWLVVQALDRVTQEQRQILEENYGKKDVGCVQKVKALYRELDLEKLYKEYEEASYEKLMSLINTKAGSLPKDIFIDFAKKIYKRDK